jgi:hypothetical protein
MLALRRCGGIGLDFSGRDCSLQQFNFEYIFECLGAIYISIYIYIYTYICTYVNASESKGIHVSPNESK